MENTFGKMTKRVKFTPSWLRFNPLLNLVYQTWIISKEIFLIKNEFYISFSWGKFRELSTTCFLAESTRKERTSCVKIINGAETKLNLFPFPR